jgi:hypothetical protein
MHGFYPAEIFIYDSSVACCMFWAAKKVECRSFALLHHHFLAPVGLSVSD